VQSTLRLGKPFEAKAAAPKPERAKAGSRLPLNNPFAALARLAISD